MSALRFRLLSYREIAISTSLLLLGVFMVAMMPWNVQAQAAANIAGDYVGALGPMHVGLHLKVDAAGGITGALDSPNQGASGIPCTDFHLGGQRLSFSVPVVHGTWKGTVSADGKTLTGIWDQGNPTPLVFTRETFVPAAKPSRIDGIWLGALKAGSTSLRIQLHVKSDNKGQEFCSLDSLDQGSKRLDCAKVTFSGEEFSFDVPVVTGHYAGKLSADGNTLAGTWTQNGNSLPLMLARQEAEIAAKPVAPPEYDAAMAPVDADGSQAVLDPDLAGGLKSGELAPPAGGRRRSRDAVRNPMQPPGQRPMGCIGRRSWRVDSDCGTLRSSDRMEPPVIPGTAGSGKYAALSVATASTSKVRRTIREACHAQIKPGRCRSKITAGLFVRKSRTSRGE